MKEILTEMLTILENIERWKSDIENIKVSPYYRIYGTIEEKENDILKLSNQIIFSEIKINELKNLLIN